MPHVSDLPRVVLDTNIVVSGLLFNESPPRRVLKLLEQGAFSLVTSDELLQEWENVLSRETWAKYGLQKHRAIQYLEYLRRAALNITNIQRQSFQVRDSQDQFILDCALTAQADFLVTGDKDLLVLAAQAKCHHLNMLTATQFIEVFLTIW